MKESGKIIREISQELGVPPGSVFKLWTRAREVRAAGVGVGPGGDGGVQGVRADGGKEEDGVKVEEGGREGGSEEGEEDSPTFHEGPSYPSASGVRHSAGLSLYGQGLDLMDSGTKNPALHTQVTSAQEFQVHVPTNAAQGEVAMPSIPDPLQAPESDNDSHKGF
jgi:hypothetical protein